MTKHFVAAGLLLMAATTAPAQTLFTYGTDSVTVPQFLAAYHKNNTGVNNAANKKQYLDLYIASRLKIKEAEERGYERLPHMQTELASLREQILPAYLYDEEGVNKLTAEAVARAQKDIDLSHIFISLEEDGLPNAAAAKEKAEKAYKELQQGKAFAEVARLYSNDPSAADNGGKVGFITVFTLPYELENLAYSTAPGSFSKPYLSKSGYHIFKNGGERKAWGRLRLAQILLAFPPDADAATDAQLKAKADSLYNCLLKGDDFGELAAQFSNDAVSAQAGGQLPEMGVGQYDEAFENIVYALAKDGAISKPFKTAHGYHIVKRLGKVPVSNSNEYVQALRARVQNSEDRMATTQAALTQKILQQAHFKKHSFNEADLWAYSDSLLDAKQLAKPVSINDETSLFTLGEAAYDVAQWLEFANLNRYKSDGSGIKPYTQVWDAFVQWAALEHYKNNLEAYNPAFKAQLQEFKEGSLFFEIMQREVWNKAQGDTAALQQFYNNHQAQYVWQKSADAILVYAPDAATAKSLQTSLTQAPQNWRELLAGNSNGALADSGRFELQQLPGKASGSLKAGSVTAPTLNSADNSYAFAYVIKVYNQPTQRSFAEARSLVMADYQTEVEKEWVESLKKKYSVNINQSALKQALNNNSRN